MKNLLTILLLFVFTVAWSQRQKPNIINYFASSNRIVGVPMVDMDNSFRFYPDVSFQEAIFDVELYYFVQNDVYKSVLTRKDEGRYWEAILRDFQLGESIQRVEVIAECDRDELDEILVHYGIPNDDDEVDNKIKYLLLRRGDDRTLSLLGNRLTITRNLERGLEDMGSNIQKLEETVLRMAKENFVSQDNNMIALNKIKSSIDTLQIKDDGVVEAIKKIEKVQKTVDSLLRTQNDLLIEANSIGQELYTKAAIQRQLLREIEGLDSVSRKQIKVDSLIDVVNTSLELDKVFLKSFSDNLFAMEQKINGSRVIDSIGSKGEVLNFFNDLLKASESFNDYQEKLKASFDSINKISIYDSIQVASERLKDLGSQLINDISLNIDRALSQQGPDESLIPQNKDSRLYFAYVENRRASMLDLKFKDDKVQYTYRNDKESLQYLQADDPQERLGIFRARLIPFAFYDEPNVSDDFKWQRGKIIYEIGMNFGYTIVKGDHFTPKFFDMNRMGIAIGITADTFSDNPTFVSAALSYDINTYSSISFGANLIQDARPYIGIGINARAFRDLVANSTRLFGQ